METLISIDIETDGPLPPNNSMLSLGAASFSYEGELLSTFSVNLKTLPGANQDPNTMAWWATNQEAYNATRLGIMDPKLAMENFVDWINKQPGKPTALCYPSGFDFTWIYWYLINFTGQSPFSFSALDIKSYACAVLKTEFRKTTKKNMPKHWFPEDKHTHIAVEDSIEQGKLFCNMLKENLNK